MADIFTKEKRSWVMSRIRGKNTKIDQKMNGILDAIGFSYEMYPKMYGNPDFILSDKRIAIFCDGDFWHGYNYSEKKFSKKYWKEKIENNMKRDRKVSRKLRSEGWSVLRFWEHDIEKRMDLVIDRIVRKIMEKRIT